MKRFSAALVVLLIGCTKPPSEPEMFYLVSSHDAMTGRWTIERINDVERTHVHYVLECEFYHLATKQRVKGSDACDLLVGEKIVPNPFPSRPDEFLDVFLIGSDTMVISKDTESDRVSEHFSIKLAQVVAYRNGA